MKNKLGRELPEYIEGYGPVIPYGSVRAGDTRAPRTKKTPDGEKLCASPADAIERIGLKDGMTVSFHHHLRNGDQVVNQVMAAIADNLVPYPACPIEISQEKVDYIVCVDSIGDPFGVCPGMFILWANQKALMNGYHGAVPKKPCTHYCIRTYIDVY